MEPSTVYSKLTETPADQTRELSKDQKSWVQSGIVIEVGKAVISVPFAFLHFVDKKKYLFTFHFDIERNNHHATLTLDQVKLKKISWNK